MLRAYLASFHPRRQPWPTRQSYAHEVVTAMTLPAGVALVEGSVIGVLAKKGFAISDEQFAVIIAAQSFALLTSVIWAHLARGRRKVPFVVGLMLALLVCVAAIGLLPVSATGALLLMTLVIVARCIIAGIITLRSTVWRHNYPRLVRARVTSKFSVLNMLVLAVAPLLAFALLDYEPMWYTWIYLGGAAIALIGVRAFSGVRLRGERELLRYEQSPRATPQPHGSPAPIYEYDPDAPRGGFWSVLRADHFYRKYMTYQFLLGASVMMSETALIASIAQWTEGMRGEYALSIAMTTTIPTLLAMLCIPLWSGRFDTTHVAQFRVHHSTLMMAEQAINWAAVLLLRDQVLWLLAVITVGRIIQGVARGGGVIAYNLGHNDFADRRLVAVYMGINVTLTGVRGAIFPFLAMALLEGVDLSRLGMPEWRGIGGHLFGVSLAMTLVAHVGFRLLCRSVRAAPPTHFE